MLVLLSSAAAMLLWGVAAVLLRREFGSNGRQAVRLRVNQDVNEMWGTPEELVRRMADEPDNPAVAIRHAQLAYGDWPELEARGRAISQRFPKLVHGPVLVVRALWQMDQKDAAQALLRRTRRRFPEDGELLEIAIEHAGSQQDWKAVTRLGHRLLRRHPGHAPGYMHEIIGRLHLGQDAAALKLIRLAEYEFELQPRALAEIHAAYDALRPPPMGEAV